MPGWGRDERIADLFWEDRTAAGPPTEEGVARYVSGDLVAYLSGEVKSLTTGTGLNPATHEALDTLVHELAEDYYEEYAYTGNKVSNVTTWETAAKLKKIRELQVTYDGNRINTQVDIQYDSSGVEDYRMTYTYTYSGNTISTVTAVRT